MALITAGFVLAIANGSTLQQLLDDWQLGEVTVAFSFLTVGAVVASRRSSNPVGWIFCVMGIQAAAGFFEAQYATYALVTEPGSLPGGRWAVWAATWAIDLFPAPYAMLLLLFPHGRFLSPRWKLVAVAILGLTAFGVLLSALSPVNVPTNLPKSPHPVNLIDASQARPVYVIYQNLAIVSFLLPIVAVALRFIRSRREERLQLKWFVFSAAVAIAAFFVAFAWELQHLAYTFAFPLIPIAAGAAILKYRLFEIDRLINRTIVYTVVSAILGAIYVGTIFGLQTVLDPLTGNSDLAIAGSTLLVAAAFRPARRLVQEFVNRRFYRSGYDAGRTVEAFSRRLRHQVDLEVLSGELANIVKQTMHPRSVTIWMKHEATR